MLVSGSVSIALSKTSSIFLGDHINLGITQVLSVDGSPVDLVIEVAWGSPGGTKMPGLLPNGEQVPS